MKIGTSTKVTIGVIGAIVAGFIGFQTVTHKETQHELKLTEKVTKKQTVKPKSKPKTVRQRSDESEKTIQDEQYSEQEIEEALAWLESLEEESSTESKLNKASTETEENNDSDKVETSEEEKPAINEKNGALPKKVLREVVKRHLEKIYEEAPMPQTIEEAKRMEQEGLLFPKPAPDGQTATKAIIKANN